MNFFKSVFSDDPDPAPSSDPPETQQPTNPTNSDPPQTQPQVWTFGGLIKTLQSKPTWVDTYRRDLEEFGSGLKQETHLFREVATKAVKDLPSSFDIESIGSSVWKSTAEIISHGKDSLLALDHHDEEDSNAVDVSFNGGSKFGKYSRFDAMLKAIQCDVNTYVGEVDDAADFERWELGFDLGGKSEEIEGLIRENGTVDEIYKRVVPNVVSHDVFWCRYYYRVYKLVEAENVRAKLVKRAASIEDEEELSWDVDEEDEEVEKGVGSSSSVSNVARNEDEGKKVKDDNVGENLDVKKLESSVEKVDIVGDKVEEKEKNDAIESVHEETLNKEVPNEGVSEENNGQLLNKPEGKVASEGKAEPSESGKDSDISVVSTQHSGEEDDMGWDEIEDIGSGDEKKVSHNGSSNREELRKRLSTADEDEDLSWGTDDDDA